MDLRSVFSSVTEKFSGKNAGSEHFLAVKISSTNIAATVWTVAEGKVEIGEISSIDLSSSDWEDLLKTADQAISKALTNIPKEVEKVVFALPSSWTQEGKVIPEKLGQLRKLCKELDLIPLGYVDLTEALQNYFKEIEGAPLTAILVAIDGPNSVLTMCRAGKNLGSVPLDRKDISADSLPAALEKALKGGSQAEILPSRIIVYDSKSDLTRIAEKITAHPWTKLLPFLHFPKVETLPSPFMAKAVAAAAALQQGGTLSEGEKDWVKEQKAEPEEKEISQEEAAEREPEKKLPEEPSGNEGLPLELEEVSAEEAGFTTDSNFHEIAFSQKRSHPEENAPLYEEGPRTEEEKERRLPIKTGATPFKSPDLKIPQTLGFITGKIKPVRSILVNLFQRKKSLAAFERSVGLEGSSKELSFSGRGVAPIILGLITLIIPAIGFVIYSIPRAEVIITLASKSFDHDMEVAVTSGGASAKGPSVNGSSIDVTESGTKKGVATGQKLVGDKAHGTVTLYNSGDSRTISAGTALATSGLKFVTNSDVTVASGSGIASQTTAQVDVTAAEIGDKYNLPTGSLFSVGNLPTSSFQGKNDQPLQGGNSHQATVVTKDDQARLIATLSAELTEQAKTDLAGKVPEGMTLLPNAMTQTVSKKKFSKDVDAQADTLSLDLTIDFHAATFSRDDVVKLFKDQFGSEIPSNYSLSFPNLSVKSARTDKNGPTYLTVHLSANLVPNIRSEDIIAQISGQSAAKATETIKKLPGVIAVKVETTPAILSFLSKFALPWQKSHIKVDLITQ